MRVEPVGGLPLRRMRAPLVRWYVRHKRNLPWRRTRDPYAIWVSEVMLQQTTVAAVVPFWERFLELFPDLPALAASREEDVLAAWSGLGYYRRAKALRAGAIAVMERHGGRVPEEREQLLALPGIGPYTAGAIASLAFSREAPVVDGNVKRVFSRVFAMSGAKGAGEERTMWAIARELVRGESPGDLNQALMELGATVCTPKAPRCPVCPLARWCLARAAGTPEAFPVVARPAPTREVRAAAAWLVRSGKLLLERRHDGGILRGTWDVPVAAVARGDDPRRALARALAARHGLAVRVGEPVARVRHAILKTRIRIEVFTVAVSGRVPRRADLRWAPAAGLASIPHSGATRKIADAAADATAQKRSQASRSRGSPAPSSSAARERPKA